MNPTDSLPLEQRIHDRCDAWNVSVDRRFETQSSVLLFGRRRQQRVVVKVVRHPGDEWVSGATLAAFGGRGVVRALDHVEGAVLLEQLNPANSLADMVGAGGDD